jgi:hypothetical protein
MSTVIAAAATAASLAAMSPPGAALLQGIVAPPPGAAPPSPAALLSPPTLTLSTAAADPPPPSPLDGLDLASMHPAAQALAEGGYPALGVGLSGSGFLAFFFIGVLSAMRDLKLIDQMHTKFAGSSGGAIISLASALGTPYETGVRAVADLLVDECDRRGNSCFGVLDQAVKAALGKALDFVPPPYSQQGGVNATVLERVNGRAFLAVSVAPPSRRELVAQVQQQLRRESARSAQAQAPAARPPGPAGAREANAPAPNPPPLSPAEAAALAQRERDAVDAALRARASRVWVVSDFPTVEDGIAAARASSFIPGFSGPNFLTTYRGRAVFDGMMTDPLPCPHGSDLKYCVRVSAVPKGEMVMGITRPILEADVAPGLWTKNGTGKFTRRDWDGFTLSLSRVADRREVERMGYVEAIEWARKVGLSDPKLNEALAARGAAKAAKAAKEAAMATVAAAVPERVGNGGVAHGAAVAGTPSAPGEPVVVG